MSECTHNCNTCAEGCHTELPDGQKPRDVLKELKKFVNECDAPDIEAMFANIADEIERSSN